MTGTLIVALTGLTLSAVSLSWQAASYFLAGPRVQVRFHEGLAHLDRSGVLLGPLAMYTQDGLESLALQGVTEPVFAVEAVNVGRLATTVEDWWIVFGNQATRTSEGGWGPHRLPHRLEPHAGATWYIEAHDLQQWQRDFTDQGDEAATARAGVRLPGKRILSDDRILIRADQVETLGRDRLARRLARRGRKPHG
jgi:hypothetical protein